MNWRMKLLLCLAVLLGPGLCALPAPLNLTMSSINFRHELRWSAAPGSPPGLTYLVCLSSRGRGSRQKKQAQSGPATCNKCPIGSRKVAASDEPRAVVQFPGKESYHSTHTLFVLSAWNGSCSAPSRKLNRFTPYLDTEIMAPNVTVSGYAKYLQINISLPKPDITSGARDMREIFPKITYKVSWRRQEEEEESESYENTTNQTVTIPHLLPGTEYCVKVKPSYLEAKFHSSAWKCGFTSSEQPPQVFPVSAVVGTVTVLIVISFSVLVLAYFGLQYMGILCKLKETLPYPLIMSLWQRPLLKPERTVPEPVYLLPGTGRGQISVWDPDEDTDLADQMEDQEDGHYVMNRCTDLSSGSGSRFSHMTSSSQSAATVTDPGRTDYERTEGEKGYEQPGCNDFKDGTENETGYEPSLNVTEEADCWMRAPQVPVAVNDWHKELETEESVDLFSVTVAALQLQSDQCRTHLSLSEYSVESITLWR